ncbi:prenyltransferase/squalene oxidase repeat-containing protein [Stratiformator vulcanicus]|uniref:Prenyltransferase and squalene oxidase repeat protein n=1 Tax=Stratiformator vulcanicus TaxID=2527980 RepID=A0A517QYJ5_9PLAN|nr:prenyltransferase/squalene oxidase repeat-containing protein [Stratiformator vulcanicus]QDT36712.1 hypothetical protein Pan189_10750 [Stratiformator vulcanicus]
MPIIYGQFNYGQFDWSQLAESFPAGPTVWLGIVATAGLCSVVGVAVFVSLLLTRWGDRHVSGKALFISIAAHAALGLGFFATAPLVTRPQAAEIPKQQVTVGVSISNDDETTERSVDRDRPVWERPPEVEPLPASERPQIDRELAMIDQPELEVSPDERLEADPVADVPSELIDEPIDPSIAAAAEENLTLDRPELPEADVSQEQIRDEESAAPGLTVRRDTNRSEQQQPIDSAEPVTRSAPEAATPLSPDPPTELGGVDEIPDDSTPEPLPTESIPSDRIARGPAPSADLPDPDDRDTPAPRIKDAPARPSFLGRRPASRSPSNDRQESLPRIERSVPGTPRSPSRLVNPQTEPRGDVEIARIAPSDIEPLPGLIKGRDASELERPELPESYRLRNPEKRGEIAKSRGGSEESEKAVDRALKWFSAEQNQQGYWDADRYGAGRIGVDENGIDRRNAGKTADSGLTALIVLAYLGAGYTHEEGDYAETVSRAMDWLIKNQGRDGYLGANAQNYEMMYCHGMATFALAEAYGMQIDRSKNPKLRRAVERAVQFIVGRQHTDGGWRYDTGQAGDMSMFGWQLMALKSAAIAGVTIPDSTRRGMVKFLRDRSLGKNNGLAGYLATMPPTAAMTAEALFAKQMLGLRRDNPAAIEAIGYLKARSPKRSELDLYYWYYGTLAMYHFGGQPWDDWNDRVREVLIADQVTDGPNAGTWDPTGPYGRFGGRLYSTVMSTLILEVYYRFLPIYQTRGEDG